MEPENNRTPAFTSSATWTETAAVTKMIDIAQVTALFRRALPQYSNVIDDYGMDLGEWDAYPVTFALVNKIAKDFSLHPTNECDIRIFFDICETLLVEGTQSVQDCIALEAIQPLASTSLSDLKLERFLGPVSKNELRNYLESYP